MSVYQHISIKNWALEDRPREKLICQGIDNLSDSELMAILLGTGSRDETAIDLARHILENVGSLSELSRSGVDRLTQTKGIGPAKAITLLAAFELGRRKVIEEIAECRHELKRAQNTGPRMYEQAPRMKVSSSEAVADYLITKLGKRQQEVCHVLFLNRNNEIKAEKQMFEGGLNATIMDVRLIFREAIHQLASGIIVVHNHPSGNLKPSQADLEVTKKLVAGGQIFDIVMLDHLIISDNGYYSFADDGKI